MIFIEAPIFEKHLGSYLSEDEYSELQKELMKNPRSGDLIRKSGGVRKLRWKAKGKGKSGGVRVIYYLATEDNIWLLTIYGKREADTIAPHILKAIKQEMDNG